MNNNEALAATTVTRVASPKGFTYTMTSPTSTYVFNAKREYTHVVLVADENGVGILTKSSSRQAAEKFMKPSWVAVYPDYRVVAIQG